MGADTIAIVDYGMGNLGSIVNMLRVLGGSGLVTSDPETIRTASKIVLPGVGAFDAGMRQLRARALIEPLNHAVRVRKVPILGICLGMQLMTRRSDEGASTGLGWIDAETLRFRASVSLKVPHMGWNCVQVLKSSRLMEAALGEQRFYFVHSYYVRCNAREDVVISAEYGHLFDAGFECANIIGVQFHPEKSHRFGKRLLQNFLERY